MEQNLLFGHVPVERYEIHIHEPFLDRHSGIHQILLLYKQFYRAISFSLVVYGWHRITTKLQILPNYGTTTNVSHSWSRIAHLFNSHSRYGGFQHFLLRLPRLFVFISDWIKKPNDTKNHFVTTLSTFSMYEIKIRRLRIDFKPFKAWNFQWHTNVRIIFFQTIQIISCSVCTM